MRSGRVVTVLFQQSMERTIDKLRRPESTLGVQDGQKTTKKKPRGKRGRGPKNTERFDKFGQAMKKAVGFGWSRHLRYFPRAFRAWARSPTTKEPPQPRVCGACIAVHRALRDSDMGSPM